MKNEPSICSALFKKTYLQGVQRIHKDERGAIMVMGLFISCFMIGCVWGLMGIGDALVFRSRMQEAADSAAFAGSSIHARGMNLIAMINLVMMLLAFIWIGLGVIRDIASLVAAGMIPCGWFPWWECALGWIAQFANATSLNNRWLDYGNDVLKPVVSALGTVQWAAAKAFPTLGVLHGRGVSKDYYDTQVINISQSLSNVVGLSGDTKKGDRNSTPIGLPVANAPPIVLCHAIFGKLSEAIGGLEIPSIITGLVVQRYCGSGMIFGLNSPLTLLSLHHLYMIRWPGSDLADWFTADDKKEGPKNMWSAAQNGNDNMQLWAVAPMVDYNEKQLHYISLANGKFETRENDQLTTLFTAESEIFFDCNNEWTNDDCNGKDSDDPNPSASGGGDSWSRASFSMDWKARLVKVRDTSTLGQGVKMAQLLYDNIKNGGLQDKLTNELSSISKGSEKYQRSLQDFNNLDSTMVKKGAPKSLGELFKLGNTQASNLKQLTVPKNYH